MSTYLLLRDNKQTGPYSLEEILTKGFKPYDLIWVEGKSAGWRYPGELPEFATIVTMVEEQPFDRFYKKKPAEASVQNTVQEKIVTEDTKSEAPIAIPADRKVYVSTPAPSPKKTSTEPMVVKDPAPAIKSINTSKEPTEPLRQMSVPDDTRTKETPAALYPDLKDSPIPPPVTLNRIPGGSSTLLKAAVVVILLLSGVIIGLLLNGRQQSAWQEQLQARVEQIKNRNEGQTAPVNNAPLVNNTDAQPVATQQEPITEPAEKAVATPVSLHTSHPLPAQKIPQKTNQSPSIEQQVTTSENKEIAPITAPSPVTIPASIAREKILPLVQVDLNKYKVGVLGGISGLEINVTNNSLYPIDMMQVIVHYLGPENKVVRDQVVVVSGIPAGQQKIVPVERSNRGVKVSYSIGKIEATASGDIVNGTH